MEGRILMDIKLDTKKILEKEFKTGMRGYNQEEVDLFLDDVIQDYQSFKKKITEIENENIQMREQLIESKNRTATPNTGATNFDIIKRITNLENHVFGEKLSGERN